MLYELDPQTFSNDVASQGHSIEDTHQSNQSPGKKKGKGQKKTNKRKKTKVDTDTVKKVNTQTFKKLDQQVHFVDLLIKEDEDELKKSEKQKLKALKNAFIAFGSMYPSYSLHITRENMQRVIVNAVQAYLGVRL